MLEHLYFRILQILMKKRKMKISSCVKRKMQSQNWMIFPQFYNRKDVRIIRDLRKQYKCDQHRDASCFVSDARHVKLTAMHLQCWAKEIVSYFINIYHSTLKKLSNQVYLFLDSRFYRQYSATRFSNFFTIW